MLKKILFSLGVIIGIILILFLLVFIEANKLAVVTQGNTISGYSNPKKALVIIDIQKNITDKGAKFKLNLKQTDQIIENTNQIIDFSKKLNLIVIYITHEFKKSSILNYVTMRILEEGSIQAQMDPRIKVINKNHFIKHQSDSFSSKEFESFLINNQINHLIITGLDAAACVDKTIKGALNRNYKITVISDGIAAKNDKIRETKVNDFNALGAEIKTTADFMK